MGDYRDNIEIDLKDLLKKIISNWRLIICLVLVGAILGGGYGYFSKFSVSEEEKADMAELEETLTDKEIMEARSAASIYLDYKKIYDEVKAYQNNSVLMSIDINLTPTARKLYLISDYDEENIYISGPSVADNIIALYQSMLYEDDVAYAISNSVDSVINKEFAKELYSMEKAGMSMLVLGTNASNERDAKKIIETLADKLMEKSDSVKAYIPHNIVEVSTTYETAYNDNIRARKQELINRLDSLNKTMIAVPSALSPSQKKYYDELVGDDAVDYGIVRDEMNKDISLQEIVKYMILGGIGLAFIYAMVITLRYIMTPVLKTEDDIRTVFGLPVIGCIKTGKNEDMPLLSYSIEARSKKEESDKICFIGAYEGTDAETKKLQLSQLLEDKELSVTLGGNVLVDAGTVEKVTDSKAVVLFEKIGCSLYDDIAKEIEFCKNYGIKILGTVVML
ncbi:MAG: hypothetical protein J6N21_22965 [Butyrivibrio sp.]|nr:hypothetical protein [Butyrivibrio sp.]